MTKAQTSQKIHLGNALEIQADTIVSRTLARTAGANMTLFGFAAGQSLSSHSSPMNAWVQILDGQMEIQVGEETFRVGQEELIHLPAGVPHALEALEATRMLLFMADADPDSPQER